jgi:ATP-binding cassette subfamily B protein
MAFVFYKQYDSMDCGPACLRMVAKHFGIKSTIQELRELTQIGKDGVNLLGISEAAEKIGLVTRPVKIDIQDLEISVSELPAIIHWKQEHFVVLYKINKGNFYLADPAIGLVQYNQEEFKKCWVSVNDFGQEEGIALFVRPQKNYVESKSKTSTNSLLKLKKLLIYLKPHKRLFFKIFIATLLSSISLFALPYLTKNMMDNGIGKSDTHFITLILLGQIVLLTSRLSIDFFRNRMLLFIGTSINLTILNDFLQKLMKLPIAFFDSKRTGDILQRMNDHNRIESFLTNSSVNTILSLIQLLVFGIVLLIYNKLIFLIFILTSLMYASWVYFFLERRRILDHKRFELSSKEQSTAIQMVQGMQEIKLNGVEEAMRLNWEKVQKTLFKLSIDVLSINQWQQAGAFFINEGKNLLITYLAAKSVISGDLTIGSMLAVQFILGQLNSPIEQLLGTAQSWQNAKMSLERLDEVHSMPDEEPVTNNLVSDIPEDFSLSFKNVCFAYPGAGNKPLLKNINLNIPKGKTTAIVGSSGSGKSTLLKLLLKFYEPDSGNITCGNLKLSNISHSSWRKNCGVVMQESFIFSDSILKNIAVGETIVDEVRLNLALKTANIDEFIKNLPLKLNTKIGSEGVGISIGQKQRILIARAVYRNPGFILLDEATNSLDVNNESIIVKNLEAFFQNRTVVVVAHRLSTVVNADQIFVMDNGRIAEIGNHAELVNKQGIYYNLIKSQLNLGA